MNQPEILYAAIFVFSMMLIGLLLTIREFYRLNKADSGRRQQIQASDRRPEGADDSIHKASGF